MAQLPKVLNIKNFHAPAGSAAYSKIVIDNLMLRYERFISKDIELLVFKDKNSYIFRGRIPSEKNFRYKTNIFYDTIIEFYPLPDTKHENSKKIIDYGMRIFSNCPTFLFNFTFVYAKMGSLYRKLPSGMYSEKALTEPPKKTNPYRLIGPEKSIWYTLRRIYEVTKYNKSNIDKILIKLPEDDPSFKFPGNIFETVDSQEDKLKEVLKVEKIKKPGGRKKKAGDRQLKMLVGGKEVATAEMGGVRKSVSSLSADLKSRLETAKIKDKVDNLKTKLKQSKLKASGLFKKKK